MSLDECKTQDSETKKSQILFGFQEDECDVTLETKDENLFVPFCFIQSVSPGFVFDADQEKPKRNTEKGRQNVGGRQKKISFPDIASGSVKTALSFYIPKHTIPINGMYNFSTFSHQPSSASSFLY